MFGDPIERVRGKPYRRYCRSWGGYAVEGTLAPLELCAQRSDGSHFPAEVAVSATEMEGGRMGVAVVRDITKRKADEEPAKPSTTT